MSIEFIIRILMKLFVGDRNLLTSLTALKPENFACRQKNQLSKRLLFFFKILNKHYFMLYRPIIDWRAYMYIHYAVLTKVILNRVALK